MAVRPKVLKYVLEQTDVQNISLPIGAKILSVQCQRNNLVFWVVADLSSILESVEFLIFGTGHDIPNLEGTHQYLGTVQMPTGLVWHVFTNKRKEEICHST